METEHQRNTYTIKVIADSIGQFAVCSQIEEFERKTDFCDEWWINKMNKEKSTGLHKKIYTQCKQILNFAFGLSTFYRSEYLHFLQHKTISFHFCNLISV